MSETTDVGPVHVLTADGTCRPDCPHPEHALRARIDVLQEALRQLWHCYQTSRSPWQHGSPCHIEVTAALAYHDPEDWYCEAEATGAQTRACSPTDPIHSAPCGWRAS